MNNNNRTIWIIIAVIVVVGGIYFMTRGPSQTATAPSTTTETTNPNGTTGTTPATTQGRVVFSATDAAANMGNVSQVNMQVSQIDVHSASTGAWTTVSTAPITFDLLALNAKKQSTLLANVTTTAGSYDQIRLTIPSVAIKTTAGTVKQAKLPSNEMTLATTLMVNKDSTASANFDFLARSSLFTTDAGDYIFAPVVTTNTESDVKLEISTANVVTVDSGHVDSTGTLAMDVDGSVKANFRISPTAKLSIGTDGSVKINTLLK